MATFKPFAALRPKPDLAPRICELPYDVMSSDEARALAAGNPLSFLHVSKPEIDLPPDADPHGPSVYAKGRENFRRLIDAGALFQERREAFYIYRQAMGAHTQTGLVGVASCEEYLRGIVKKHELTRPDKEDDRVRHIEALDAQTGPVFLTYPASSRIDAVVAGVAAGAPDVDFTAADGIRHSAWTVRDDHANGALSGAFGEIPAFYIADGHHRSAAAARVFQSRQGAGRSGWFLSVAFPDNQLRILPYNRALKDWNGRSPAAAFREWEKSLLPAETGIAVPRNRHEVCVYAEGEWRLWRFRPELCLGGDPVELLDVALLQKHVLGPVFGIQDPRTDQRISFIGGIRGTAELEKLVNSGAAACAVSMYPTQVGDLMSVSDAGGIMPPKSTWFEPKLRDAMFCHLIG
ncbi:MAG: DUF1015 family protein [Verrucomicrobiota bacterium]